VSASLTISGAAADLARLYPWLDETTAADALPEALAQKIHVALEEAVANVALHAYAGDTTTPMTIEYAHDSGSVTLTLTDSGPPFDPTTAQAPKDAEIGGNGLNLIRHFCKDLTYRRLDGRNQLTMRF